MKCNLDELRSNIKNKENLENVNLCIESICRRTEYAIYHFREYNKIINSIKSQRRALEYLFKNDDAVKNKLVVEANILALIQNLHAIYDILGYLICYSLDLKFKNDTYINLKNVKEKMLGIRNLENMQVLINNLISHQNSEYLNAIVNVSKHRYVIVPQYSISFVKDEYGYKFSSFTFNKKDYEEKKIHEFILEEYERESKLVIEIENELIKYLKVN